MGKTPFASPSITSETAQNSLRLIGSSFSLTANATATKTIFIGNDHAYNLLAITEYHVGGFKFNYRLLNQDWTFLASDATMTWIYNDALFSIDPTNSLTEAKFVLPRKLYIAGSSGLEVQVIDTSGTSNTVELTFQLERA